MQIKPKHIANWQILTLLGVSLGLAYALPLAFDAKPPRFLSPPQKKVIAESEEAALLRAEIASLEAQIEVLTRQTNDYQTDEVKARDVLRDADEKLGAAKAKAEDARAALEEAQKRDSAAKQSLIEARQAEQEARRALVAANDTQNRATKALQAAKDIEQEAQRALQAAISQLAQTAQSDKEIERLQGSIEALSRMLAAMQDAPEQATADLGEKTESQAKETDNRQTQTAQITSPRRLPKPGKVIRYFDDNQVKPDYVMTLPNDLKSLTVAERKARFVEILLPLILRENERLEARAIALELAIAKNDQEEIGRLKTLYRLSKFEGDDEALYDELRLRIAPIPPSLALAQAAVESGWGLSRFAEEGNALFGQWAWSADAGIKPRDASNSRAVIRSFSTLYGSVVAYMHNLNTHFAYAPLRERRQQLTASGAKVTGFILAEHLAPYAETGEKYIFTLKSMIRQNRFDHYEDHQLVTKS